MSCHLTDHTSQFTPRSIVRFNKSQKTQASPVIFAAKRMMFSSGLIE